MRKLLLVPLLLGFSVPVFSQQLISDKQIGKTLGQVMCGEKDMNTAGNYLINMGVPMDKIQNVTNYPAIVTELKKYQRRCN